MKTSPTHAYEYTISASGTVINDFSADFSALKDRPFNFIRIISNQKCELYLDTEKYFIEANTITPIFLEDRVFYSIKINNISTSDASVKIEVQKVAKKTDLLADKILTIINKVGI